MNQIAVQGSRLACFGNPRFGDLPGVIECSECQEKSACANCADSKLPSPPKREPVYRGRPPGLGNAAKPMTISYDPDDLDALLAEFEDPWPVKPQNGRHEHRVASPLPGAEKHSSTSKPPRPSLGTANVMKPSFPATPNPAYARFTASGLVEAIQNIGKAVLQNPSSYEDHRESFCALNLELNRREVTFAPRFRGAPRPTYGAPTPAERLLGLDRQIIDLHWLHSRGVKRRIATDIYEDLLLEEEFNFDMAQDFAAEAWTGDHKAALLSLPTQLQWQLDTLQPSNFADRFRRLRNGERSGDRMRAKGLPQIRAELENSIINLPQCRGSIDEWATLWLCYQMIGDKAPAALVSLYSVATGTTPMAPSSISRKLKRALARLE